MTNHKQAAIEAGAKALPGIPAHDEELRLMQNTARAVIEAALPELRAMIAQEILRAIVPIQPVGTMHEGENRGLRLAARIAKGPQQ